MHPWQPGAQPGPEQSGTPQAPGAPGAPGNPTPQYPGAQQPPYPPPGQYAPYPQYSQHPQYSQYPQYPQQGFGGPAPSGGTAIGAAVLSFLGALANILGALGNFSVASMPQFHSQNTGLFVVMGVVALAIAAALAVGGIMLLRRNLVGRMIIAIACGVVIVLALVGYLMAQALLNQAGLSASATMPSLLGRTIGSIVFPVVTMALALVPSTKNWCLAGRQTSGW